MMILLVERKTLNLDSRLHGNDSGGDNTKKQGVRKMQYPHSSISNK